MSLNTNQQLVEHLPIDEIKVSKRQARAHPEEQVKALADSITRFGFTVPLLIDEKSRVLAGHGRLLAARKCEMTQVPCLRVHHLTEDEKRAYKLADNRLGEMSKWNNEVVGEELQHLLEVNFPIQLTGFPQPEVDRYLQELAESSPQPGLDANDDIPPVRSKSVTRLGDKWQLDRHLLLCGDARDRTALIYLLGTEEVRAIFTDPPWNLSVRRQISRRLGDKHGEFVAASGEMSREEYLRFLIESFQAMTAVCRDGAILFVCIDWRHMHDCVTAGEGVGLELKNLVVWAKTNAGLGTFYRSKHELIFVWKFGTAAHINTFGLGDKGRYRTNVWTYAGVNTFKSERAEELAYHPTTKPCAMVMDAIRDVSHRGDIILDPFGGSGTTLIAAHRTGRIARLIELDPRYCDVTIRRFEKLTGKFARLVGTDQTFEEVEADRRRERLPDRDESSAVPVPQQPDSRSPG